MNVVIKYTSIFFAFVLLTACGGGGVETASNEDTAAALVLNIRNAAAAVSAMTVVNGANN